jgi:Na+/proline symporter
VSPVLDPLGFVVVLLLLLIGVAYRPHGDEDFLVADRRLSLFPLVATLVMTEFNTSTLLAFSAAGYRAGPMALALPLVFLVGLLFYTVTVARAWKRFDRLSVAELFATRYSPALGRFASVLLLLSMVGFGATYVKSLGLLFDPFVPWLPPAAVSGLLTLVVLAAALPGGLVSVVRSDVVSFVLTLALVPMVLGIGMWHSAGAGGLASVFDATQRAVDPIAQWSHPALPFRFVVTLIALTCVTYIAAPWYGQKIFAARDVRTAFRAVAWAAVLVFVLYGGLALAAAHLRVVQPGLEDAQTAVPVMMSSWLPAGIRGAGFGLLFAAALTTLAGVWTAMAAMVAADFGWRDARHIYVQRRVIAGFALLHWLGAVFLVEDILNRLILANIPVVALSFALLAGFHWPRATTAGAWASVTVGVCWGVGAFVLVGEAGGYTWPWAIYGIPLIFATGVTVSLLSTPETRTEQRPARASSTQAE